MVTDKNLYFSDQQSLVAAAGAIMCDRSLSLGAPQAIPLLGSGTGGPHDIGAGSEIEVVVQMNTGLDSAGGACTLKAELIMADNEALTTNAVILHSSQAIAEATAVAGYQFRLGATLPIGLTKNFLGVKYTTAGEDATVGTVSAFLTQTRQSTFVG